MTGIRIPITNFYGQGDYTGAISLGSTKAKANVILDTGSSTLAVRESTYKPKRDANLRPTAIAQDITYGTGGWAGPVVSTNISVGSSANIAGIADGSLALALAQEPDNFGPADGILGLAYTELDNGYDLESYLRKKGIAPPVCYPWPFSLRNSQSSIEQFGRFISKMPAARVTPFFTQIVKSGKVANKFAFYTHRSTPRKNSLTDPANKGFFILGGGEEQKDLYRGNFVDIEVAHDVWYNTTLKTIVVAGTRPTDIEPLAPQFRSTMVSNSIVDSGTNSLSLSREAYGIVMRHLGELNPDFERIATRSVKGRSVLNSQLNLKNWPNITFVMADKNGRDVPLTCTPQTYWQLDSFKAGEATFQVDYMGEAQSILGLPLFNNYYMVFDRSVDTRGVIRLAKID